MGIVQVAWRSTLCPRRSRRRRAVMTCSSARSPSSPSQLIPASRSSVTVGGESVGSLIRAPCNVSGSSSHPATSALPLLLPCLFYGCLPLCFPASRNDWHRVQKCACSVFLSVSAAGTCKGIFSAGYSRSIWLSPEPLYITVMIIPNALPYCKTHRNKWWRFQWLVTPRWSANWTFKPSGTESDRNFNSWLWPRMFYSFIIL